MSESSATPVVKPLLSDAAYNRLKASATILLPAAGALYFALAQIWHLPKAEEVTGSVAALNTFIGVLVGLSSRSYNKSDAKYVNDSNYVGEMVVDDSGPKTKVSLRLNDEAEEVLGKKEVLFKVVTENTGINPIIKP